MAWTSSSDSSDLAAVPCAPFMTDMVTMVRDEQKSQREGIAHHASMLYAMQPPVGWVNASCKRAQGKKKKSNLNYVLAIGSSRRHCSCTLKSLIAVYNKHCIDLIHTATHTALLSTAHLSTVCIEELSLQFHETPLHLPFPLALRKPSRQSNPS